MQKFLITKQVIQVVTKSIMVEARTSEDAVARALNPDDFVVQNRWESANCDRSAIKEKVLDVAHFGALEEDDD